MDKNFTFSESDTQKLAEMLADCQGVAYYNALVNAFFSQLEAHQVAARNGTGPQSVATAQPMAAQEWPF